MDTVQRRQGTFSADVPTDKGGDTVLHIIVLNPLKRDLVRRIVMDAPRYAHVPNRAKRTPLDIARGETGSPECLQAIYDALYFDGRFELDGGNPAHQSDTCIVVFATDRDGAQQNSNKDGGAASTGCVVKSSSSVSRLHVLCASHIGRPG